MVYFIPSNGSTLLTTLDADSFKSIRAEDGQRGVEGNLTMSADVSFGVTLSASLQTSDFPDVPSRFGAYVARLHRVWRCSLPFNLQLHPWQLLDLIGNTR